MALEQNGRWGARAAAQSHLDPEVGMALDRICQDADGALHPDPSPGAHPDAHEGRPRRVYLAGGLGDRPWLLQETLDDPARLLRLPWAALSEDDIAAMQHTVPELDQSPTPVLLVCANSRRDACCGVHGPPVAGESSLQRPGRVWECSHTGGHRFAPTGVVLPHGQTFGRLSYTPAVAAVAATREEAPKERLGYRVLAFSNPSACATNATEGAAISRLPHRLLNPLCDNRFRSSA